MKAKLSLAMGVALLAGCAQMPPAASINANGAIKWANGITEDMHISASGGTLTFASPQSLFNPGGITIFSRIDSARNGACEHYYSEQAVKTRMNICDSGEVTLLVEGQVINVGSLAKFVY